MRRAGCMQGAKRVKGWVDEYVRIVSACNTTQKTEVSRNAPSCELRMSRTSEDASGREESLFTRGSIRCCKDAGEESFTLQRSVAARRVPLFQYVSAYYTT